MTQTTFEIIFNANQIDSSIYPEASMTSKNSIVVDADNRYAITSGKDEVKLSINGQIKTYSNVWAVCPYFYQY